DRGARAGTGLAAGGLARARRAALADHARHRPPADRRRDRDGDGARRRARRRRDRTAALHHVAGRERGELEPDPPGRLRAARDLRAVGVARPGRPCAGLGRRARSAAVHPLREPDSPLARDPKQAQDPACRQMMSEVEGESVTVASTIERAVGVEPKRQPLPPRERLEEIFDIQDLDAIYGSKPALKGVSMEVYQNLVTAVIGPSGCGKSTFIRCLNRMNDLVPGFRQTGAIRYHGVDIASGDVDPVAVRRTIGMVFQRPNPFPKSIFDNVAWGLKVLGMKDNLSDRVERALTQAALWDEVKDRLKASGLSLSGGQQQRLCIARAIAVEPDV